MHVARICMNPITKSIDAFLISCFLILGYDLLRKSNSANASRPYGGTAVHSKIHTMEPQFYDCRFSDIPNLTIHFSVFRQKLQ